MKKLLCFLSSIAILLAQSPAELPDFTAQVTIRNLYSGDAISLRNDRFNWTLKEMTLPEELQFRDPYAKLFRLGTVQFRDVKRDNVCLAFSEGHLRPKGCFEDVTNRQLETVFSIIPTTTTAVQLRSLAGDGRKCLVFGKNDLTIETRPFLLKPCNLDANTQIDLKELFLILPPFTPSKVTNP